MGTRSLTKIIEKCDDGSKKTITTMYRQYDGYPSGHGIELAEWLSKYHVVNGISLNDTRLIANGMDCLAAQMFAHFKDGPGGIYCMRPDAKDYGEEYIYEILGNDSENLSITIRDVWKKKIIFKGSPEQLLTLYENVETN
jgi:hypothetical protein|tara:strand:+ start:812 stop:1231 length:420 start_codon:yes stop_codon:yes gene_type:complete